jgi:hypothetical protein
MSSGSTGEALTVVGIRDFLPQSLYTVPGLNGMPVAFLISPKCRTRDRTSLTTYESFRSSIQNRRVSDRRTHSDKHREKTMRSVTVKKVAFAAFLGCGLFGTGVSPAEAQLFGRRRVTVQETVETPTVVVAPPPVVVAPSRVKVKPRKVVIREKRGVIARVPAIVTSSPVITKTKVVQPPVVEERIIPSDPVGEEKAIQLEPTLESPAISTPR